MSKSEHPGQNYDRARRSAGSLQGKRLPALDGLRGIAILLVIVCHYAVEPSKLSPDTLAARVLSPLSWSWAGVDLFFVLSGFLIGSILLTATQTPNFYQGFFARRAARLLPPYLSVVALYFAIGPLLADPPSTSARWLFEGGQAVPWWVYLIHGQNIFQAVFETPGGHGLAMTWSLAVEEQFYLLLPALLILTPRQKLAHRIFFLLFSALLLRTALYAVGANVFTTYVLLPCRWDSLLAGVLVALLWQDDAFKEFIRRKRHLLSISLLASLTGLLFAGAAFELQWYQPWMRTSGLCFIAVISVNALLVALVADGGRVRAVLCNSWLRQLGVISYGVYLVHQLVHGLIRHAVVGTQPNMATFADGAIAIAALVVSVAIAAASWKWLEKPLISAVRAKTDGLNPALKAALVK